MAKFFGQVGYSVTAETRPGVWTPGITEVDYYGDVIRNNSRWVPTDKVNDDISVNNRISIVADPFAYENFQHIRYVRWMNQLWKVSDVEVQYPRLILDIGGVYNGETS